MVKMMSGSTVLCSAVGMGCLLGCYVSQVRDIVCLVFAGPIDPDVSLRLGHID